MLLRTKFLLIFTLLFVVYAGKDFFTNRYLILPTFFELDRYQAMMSLKQCNRFLDDEIDRLDVLCKELSEKRETRSFVTGASKDFLTDSGTDLVFVYDMSGELKWEENRNELKNVTDSLHRQIRARAFGARSKKARSFSGVVSAGNQAIAVAFHPVLANEKVAGVLVLGRIFDGAFVRSAANRLRMDFGIFPAGMQNIPEDAKKIMKLRSSKFPVFVEQGAGDDLVVYSAFSGLDGKTAFLIEMKSPRLISAVGTATINYALLYSMTGGIIMIIIILTLVERAILNPLKQLTEHTREIVKTGDLSARLGLKRKDETGILAEKFDDMLDTLEKRSGELAESEKRYRLFVEGASDAIFITGENEGLVFVNEAASILTGYPREELESMRFHDLFEYNGEMRFADDFESMIEDVSVTTEAVMTGENGKTVVTELSNRRIMIEDKPCLHTVARNITGRKRMERTIRESENYFRSLLYSMHDDIIVVDREHRITDINRDRIDILDMSREEIIGRYCFDAFSDFGEMFDRRGGKSLLMKVFKTGEMEITRLSHRRSDGSRAWTDMRISPLDDENRKIRRLIIVMRDITNEIQLENRLLQTQKMEAIGTLAGGIAHDFNNILMTMMINIEFALDELGKDHPVSESLDLSLGAGHRAKDLVDQILTFSRKTERELGPLKVAPIIKEAMKMLRSTLPATIEIRQDINAESDTVVASPSQINQIVFNLCTNAAFAMKDTGGSLFIGLSEEKNGDGSEKPFLRLRIADTGPGIAQEIADRIFDPFFTTKKPGEGTGMGLSVVHGILTEVGGSISASSESGRGAVFDVFFPLAESAGAFKRPSEIPPPMGKGNILIVDDEEYLVRSLEKSLPKYGFGIVGETNAEKALEIFRKNPGEFDMVVTDQTMPGITGAELAKKLLDTRPDIPVVLCTGFSEEIVTSGIRKVIKKPVAASELAKIINEILTGA